MIDGSSPEGPWKRWCQLQVDMNSSFTELQTCQTQHKLAFYHLVRPNITSRRERPLHYAPLSCFPTPQAIPGTRWASVSHGKSLSSAWEPQEVYRSQLKDRSCARAAFTHAPLGLVMVHNQHVSRGRSSWPAARMHVRGPAENVIQCRQERRTKNDPSHT